MVCGLLWQDGRAQLHILHPWMSCSASDTRVLLASDLMLSPVCLTLSAPRWIKRSGGQASMDEGHGGQGSLSCLLAGVLYLSLPDDTAAEGRQAMGTR